MSLVVEESQIHLMNLFSWFKENFKNLSFNSFITEWIMENLSYQVVHYHKEGLWKIRSNVSRSIESGIACIKVSGSSPDTFYECLLDLLTSSMPKNKWMFH